MVLSKNGINNEKVQKLTDKSCEQQPSKRINYVSFLEKLSEITSEIPFDNKNSVVIKEKDDKAPPAEVIEDLNNPYFKPKFNIKPEKGDNILLDICTECFFIHCLWIISDNNSDNNKKLKILNQERKEDKEKEHSNTLRFGKELGLPIEFTSNGYRENDLI